MRQALGLAARALGRTSPNPVVGAVIYRGDRLIGQGYHKGPGLVHAEVEAIRAAGDDLSDAVLYVTLEPCNHFGRTPPCSEAVIASGLKKVVVGMRDPNPHVAGGGIRRLEEAGVLVTVGILEAECRELNEPFVTATEQGRPMVILKSAVTMDGKTASSTGDSKWITGEESRRFVHQLRSRYDAVMVGSGTALRDNPRLTCRLDRGGKDPVRIIVDSHLGISPEANVFHGGSTAPTLIATLASAPGGRARMLEGVGARIIRLPEDNGRVAIEPLLRALAADDIQSVLLEGGSTLNGSFLRAGMVDKLYLFYAPKLMGGSGSRGMVDELGAETVDRCLRLGPMNVRRFGADLMVETRPLRENA